MAIAALAPLAGAVLPALFGGGKQQDNPISNLLKTLMGGGGGLPNPVQGILKSLGGQ